MLRGANAESPLIHLNYQVYIAQAPPPLSLPPELVLGACISGGSIGGEGDGGAYL